MNFDIVLFIFVISLIAVERFVSKSYKGSLLKINTYFWMFLNLGALSFIVSKYLSFVDQNIFSALHIKAFVDLSHFNLVFQSICFLLLYDLASYFYHACFHKFGFLWKLHSVHHSSTTLNALASFKQSWLEAFITITLNALLAKFVYVDFFVLSWVSQFYLFLCILQHTSLSAFNFKNRFIRSVFITPALHQIHHEKRSSNQHENLGFLFTFWDRLFNTYSGFREPSHIYGLSDKNYPHDSNWRQFFYPIRWNLKGRYIPANPQSIFGSSRPKK